MTGKSTLLAAIAQKELPIPDHIDTFLLRREMPPSDKTAMECVMEVDEMRIHLEKEAEILATKEDNGNKICSFHGNLLGFLKFQKFLITCVILRISFHL